MITATAARVLCFGDSNTWGAIPGKKARYSAAERWPGRLQGVLGSSFDIIEEGLNSRTTDVDYANRPGRNGREYLIPCLQSQNPLAGVVVMLGTNDIKVEFNRSAVDIAQAIRSLVDDIRTFARDEQGNAPQILLVSPAPVNPETEYFKEKYTEFMNETSVTTSRELAAEIAKVAQVTNCAFFDAGKVAQVGTDGIHLTREAHVALGAAIAGIVREWM